MCKFQIDQITFSKPQSRTRYDDTKISLYCILNCTFQGHIYTFIKLTRVCLIACHTFHAAKVPSVCQPLIFTCQCANKHANVPKVYQLFNTVPMCLKVCQIFKHSSYKMLRETSIFYLYIKSPTLYLISQLYI